MTTELTPAVQDALWQAGYTMARAGIEPDYFIGDSCDYEGWSESSQALTDIFRAGHAAFTPEAEAERVEAVREAGCD